MDKQKLIAHILKSDLTAIEKRYLEKLVHSANHHSWISVKDRLPERDKTVLVAVYGSDCIFPENGESLFDAIERTRKSYVTVTLAFIGSDGWYDSDFYPMIVAPSYWMPLPEPPEVNEE